MRNKIIFIIVTIIIVFIILRLFIRIESKDNEQSPTKLSEIGVLLYFEGNYDDAVGYLTKAADLGDSQAQTFLGICYRYGQGVKQNDSIGAEWYRKAAMQGDSVAQYNLSNYYFSKYDSIEGVRWLMKAANNSMLQAQYEMGLLYQYGTIVTQDSSLAAEWYMKAALHGHSNAEYRTGMCYEYGIGQEKNDSLAARWYETAVENDQNPEALFALARYHEEGKGGFVRNDTIAAQLLLKAAQLGHSDAQFKLSIFYSAGRGGPKDAEKSSAWMLKAAQQKNKAALNVMEQLPDSIKQQFKGFY